MLWSPFLGAQREHIVISRKPNQTTTNKNDNREKKKTFYPPPTLLRSAACLFIPLDSKKSIGSKPLGFCHFKSCDKSHKQWVLWEVLSQKFGVNHQLCHLVENENPALVNWLLQKIKLLRIFKWLLLQKGMCIPLVLNSEVEVSHLPLPLCESV